MVRPRERLAFASNWIVEACFFCFVSYSAMLFACVTEMQWNQMVDDVFLQD